MARLQVRVAPPRRAARALAVVCACVPALVLPTWPAVGGASAGNLHRLRRDLSRQLARAGRADGAYVYDVTAQRPLFSLRAHVRRPPASLEKLYTSTAALARMGADARLSTVVLGTGRLAPGGVWEGDIYLRGGGDPTFGSSRFIHARYRGLGASMSTLASQLVHADGIRRITGRVYGDESYFDSLRGEPSSGYAPDFFLEGVLSGLAFNRGASGAQRGPHAPATYAAHELLMALKRHGVSIGGHSGAATAPTEATPLAEVQSATLAQLLGLMLPPSDNFFAETLLKDLGARYGGAGTTSAGAAVVRQTISSLMGLHPRLVDGSGLSRADKTSPYEVASLLVQLVPAAIGQVLRGDLAVAGRTGTLSERMRKTAAAGRCEGKTGTLTGASNLAGYCDAANGHTLAFAIFTDNIAIPAAHVLQDRMTIAIARY
jgi:D-alanyl-D-alanine carboxypeptidase/D-alanyl-D-alanine-endopeptidase (penicillin-binding protein 4)